MKQYIATKTCFWGPTPGTQTVYAKDSVILARGDEPDLLEFFEPVEKEAAPSLADPEGAVVDVPAKGKAKPGPKPKKPPVEDLNDL